MTNPISILSTKILSVEHRQAFINANIDLLEDDFIAINKTDFELSNVNQNLIFSSQNAILSLIEQPNWEQLFPRFRDKTVFCVGVKSKELLEKNGFTVAVYMDYASELAEIITLIYSKESFTFFSGNLRKETLPKALKGAHVNFNEIVTYETKLTPFKISAAEKFDGILFFSPSAVESYLIDNKIKNEICFCIGETTAEALKGITKNIIIPEIPSTELLIEEVIQQFHHNEN